MRKKFTEQIRAQVNKAYEAISDEFDRTRKNKWSEFEYFSDYIKPRSKVLDLGCGNGRLYGMLESKKIDYLGIDNSQTLIEKAMMNFPNAKFQYGDMVSLDLPDDSYDAVFSIASFHHIPGKKLRREAADEINRALKPDGILILMVWNLFQWKYLKALLISIISFVCHFGLKYAWNDLWIKWGDRPLKRYYHAFLPSELLTYFQDENWKIKELYFSKRGNRVKFLRSFNICLIAKKIRT
jgi:SAM-dependent methyltransferase